jgi:hypothetical protein
MSRYQRRGLGWGLAAGLILMFWWFLPSGSPSPTAVRTVQLVEVVRPIAAGAGIRAGDVALRRVEYSHGLAHALGRPADVIGRRAAVALAPGSPVMDAEVAAGRSRKGVVDVAVKVDTDAGVPAGVTSDVQGDLLLTVAGRRPHTGVVLSDVTVVSATHSPTSAVVTLRLPADRVIAAIEAESEGDLRLVVRPSGDVG